MSGKNGDVPTEQELLEAIEHCAAAGRELLAQLDQMEANVGRLAEIIPHLKPPSLVELQRLRESVLAGLDELRQPNISLDRVEALAVFNAIELAALFSGLGGFLAQHRQALGYGNN